MKILSAAQIRELDQYTIQNEPISSLDLMERAATTCFRKILEHFPNIKNAAVFCGVGNNGGDGLVIARLLHQKNIRVQVFIIEYSPKKSPDFKINYQRLKDLNIPLQHITDENFSIDLSSYDIVIDAIFGSGLSRPVEGFTAKVIEKINLARKTVVAVDFPSGLFDEDNSSNNYKNIIKAQLTLTFQVPKLSFFFPENAPFVGKFEILDIGLSQEKIQKLKTPYHLIDESDITDMLKSRPAFAHKGNFGHALLTGGSYGMMGAMVLAAQSCVKAGAGKITALIPECGYNILQTSVPEAMCITVNNKKHLINCKIEFEKYDAIAVGCGMGKHEDSQRLLKNIIQNSDIPLIIDADALNILSLNKTWINFLPPQSILTPHKKEFERLFGKTSNSYQTIRTLKEKAVKHQIYIILKGKYSAIATPKGNIFFNPTGNPGMATGGSGDVLTGLLAGLSAQGYHPVETALTGTYIHGLAGDAALAKESEETLSATSIIEHLAVAFKYLHEKKIKNYPTNHSVSQK
ncbi:MAG: NAD(P)H-hydrate dehydratase [Bacteroidetes bacterium]|nr:MAG: NAD(P)H-hydrate dehydratase [Bacteroidota bacterium]